MYILHCVLEQQKQKEWFGPQSIFAPSENECKEPPDSVDWVPATGTVTLVY